LAQPDHAYFGQKDIQQALLLKRMAADLLMAHPPPAHVHIVPTARDAADGLALSSRNAHLAPAERRAAPALYAALGAAQAAWDAGASARECVARACEVVERATARAAGEGVDVRLDYVEMNDSGTFDALEGGARKADVHPAAGPVILSGAVWVGKTRLIDNILLGDVENVVDP
jgi:pantoate--beta-alanine ligase